MANGTTDEGNAGVSSIPELSHDIKDAAEFQDNHTIVYCHQVTGK